MAIFIEKDRPEERFSDRAALYVRYRPSYPTAVYTRLQTDCRLTSDAVIADIGSGTGLLAHLFLERGHTVYGVEPNRAMREAGEQFLAGYDRFHSINASAEATTLPDKSVDFVTAGQAAHWFDPLPAKAEFERILRPNGHILFLWNSVDNDGSPFMREQGKAVSTYHHPAPKTNNRYASEDILGDGFTTHDFDNFMWKDYEALEGGALSSSNAPLAGDPSHKPFVAELRRLFDLYEENGRVLFHFKTRLYCAKRP